MMGVSPVPTRCDPSTIAPLPAAVLTPAAGAPFSVGVSSTQPSPRFGTALAGLDTWKLLYRVDPEGLAAGVFDLGHYRATVDRAHGLLGLEGHPSGTTELLAPVDVPAALAAADELADGLGGTFHRVSRVDLTAPHHFRSAAEGRAFFTGMSVLELPRAHTIARHAPGQPAHSIAWTGATSARRVARCYDKGLERGTAEPWLVGRLEDQRRSSSGRTIEVSAWADRGFCRETFERRFRPMQAAVDGVHAASFPVISQAIADEARYGYRSVQEAERLAGSLVLLRGGAGDAYSRSTFYARRAALREAGYVLSDGPEGVNVDLAGVFESAISSW